MEDNVSKFLNFLGKAEGADYDTIVGGGKFTDFSKHPNIVGLRTKEGPSTAAGKYQITHTTYADVAPKLGITDFSPESQDKIAVELIRRAGALPAVERGDWKTAIGKLGGTWASLPSSPYSQPKRSAEFVQKNLGNFNQPPSLEYGQTSPGSIAPTDGPSAAGLEVAEAQREAKYGGIANAISNLPTAIEYGFENENSVYNFFKDQGISKVDPDFSWTPENGEKALEGIPPENRDYILQAHSWDEAVARRGRVMDALQRQQELAQMGMVGMVGNLTGSLVDVPTLVGFLPVVGDVALVSKTSRLANALSSGLAAAAGNVAVDAATLKYRPLGTTDDLYFSALAGLGMGALTGGIINPVKRAAAIEARTATRDFADAIERGGDEYTGRRFPLEEEAIRLQDFGRKQMQAQMKREIEAAGLKLTDQGKKILGLGDDVDEATLIRDEKASIPQTTLVTDAIPTDALPRGRELPPKFPSGADRPSISAKSILQSLGSNSDPLVAGLSARILDQLVDDVNVYEVPNSMLYQGSRSYYDPSRHAVFLRKDAPDRIKLHEIAHAATVQKIIYGRENRDTVHGKLVTDLDNMLEAARAAASREGLTDREAHYYLSNLEEFTAGLYSGDTQFTKFLARQWTSDGDSLLSKVVDTVRKLLGMDPKESNMLLKSLDLTDQLIGTKLDVSIQRPGASEPVMTIHMEPQAGVSVDPEMIRAAASAGLNDVFGWSFGLEHRLRRVKNLTGARRLADKLIGTVTGYKNNAVVERNAYDQALQLSDGWITSIKKVAAGQFDDYAKRTGVRAWQRGDAAQKWNEDLGDYIRGFDGDYDKSIITTGEQIKKTLADVVDHINNPAKATGGTKRGLTQDIYVDENGNQLLTDPLPKNSNYLPRQNDVQKWDSLVNQFGRDFVEKWWAGAFKSANPDVSDEVAARFGKFYVKAVEAGRKNHDAEFLSEQLRGLDKEALRDSMKNAGLSDAEADELLDGMFPKAHKGQSSVVSNTKQRSAIDETFSMDAIIDGETQRITINDFINTDTLDVLNAYFKRMGGAISLANHADIYKNSDIGRVIMDATKVELGDSVSQSALHSIRSDLQFTIDRLLHRPVEDFSPLNKGMEMWRNFNVLRLMGAAVYNQVQELSQIVGTMGWKATLEAIPMLGGLRRDLLSGKVGNPILNDLENMIGGAGADLVMRRDFTPSQTWVKERGNTKFNQWLDRADNGLKKLADNTLKYTGMTGVMVQQKRIHAIAFVNHFFKVSRGEGKLGFNPERLAWMGLEQSDVDKVLNNMRRFAKEKNGVAGGKVGTVDFDAWRDADPENLSKFVTAFQRESRRVVQENDLASQIPIMSKGWAQTTFQFLNFVMHAWNKSLLFSMNHRDFETFSTVMHGAFFAALTYMARTEQQMIGMSDEERMKFANKRLSTEQIVANSFGRISQASILPNIIDQVSPTPIFSGARTTSDTSSILSSNPTASAIATLGSMWRKGIRNATSDNYQTTEKDARSWLRLAPLNNVIGINQLLNSLVNDLPHSEQVNPDPSE